MTKETREFRVERMLIIEGYRLPDGSEIKLYPGEGEIT